MKFFKLSGIGSQFRHAECIFKKTKTSKFITFPSGSAKFIQIDTEFFKIIQYLLLIVKMENRKWMILLESYRCYSIEIITRRIKIYCIIFFGIRQMIVLKSHMSTKIKNEIVFIISMQIC
jgi:hypothetical protein